MSGQPVSVRVLALETEAGDRDVAPNDAGGRAGHVVLALLHDVCQLVGEQVTASVRRIRGQPVAEVDGAAGGERSRPEAIVESSGHSTGMDGHTAEVRAERALHLRAHLGGQRASSGRRSAQRPMGVGVELTALRADRRRASHACPVSTWGDPSRRRGGPRGRSGSPALDVQPTPARHRRRRPSPPPRNWRTTSAATASASRSDGSKAEPTTRADRGITDGDRPTATRRTRPATDAGVEAAAGPRSSDGRTARDASSTMRLPLHSATTTTRHALKRPAAAQGRRRRAERVQRSIICCIGGL